MNKSYKPYTLQLGALGMPIARTTLHITRLRKLFWRSLILGIPYVKIMWYQSGVGYRTFELINGEYQMTESIGALCGVSYFRKVV